MRVLIWGAGAIGGTLGAYFARAGHDVTLVDTVTEHVEIISARGLSITGPIETFNVHAPAFTPAELTGQWACVLLCTKAQHTETALSALRPHLTESGYVVSVQNGLNELTLADVLGEARVLGSFVNFGADYQEPGVIHYGGRGAVVLGELDGQDTPRLKELHNLFLTFDDDAVTTPNIWGYLWGKLAYGAMLFATALTNASIADALDHPDYRTLYIALGREVLRVAEALDIHPEAFSSLEEQLAVKNLERRYVDGLIICSLKVTSTFLKQVEAARQRVCVIGSIPEAVPVDSVRVDSAAGAGLALAHLVDTGRQQIAFINGDAHTVPAEARLRGYQAEFERQHLNFDSALVMNTAFTVQGGYDAAATLLGRAPGIDAFFCANDLIALGALRKLQELGKNVPQEIAVVGMDNIDLTRVSNPTLSSVSLLAGERGRLAAELLLERLEEPDLEPRNIVIMPRLVIRESSTGYIVGATQETSYVSV